MAGPKRHSRLSRLSQFWLPTLLFVLSVVSILFTLGNDDIPVIGPSERAVLDTSDLDGKRVMINQALHKAGSWQKWCENPVETLQSIQFANYQTQIEDKRWTELRRHLPQAEQDALLRCHNLQQANKKQVEACLFMTPVSSGSVAKAPQPALHLLEMSVELRLAGKKQLISCREALASASEPIELAIFYSYYWTAQLSKRPLRFVRLTGGTRIFPPLAQNTERPAEKPTLDPN